MSIAQMCIISLSTQTHVSARYDKCEWGPVNIYLSLAPIFFPPIHEVVQFLFFVCVSLFAFVLSFSSIFDPPFVPSPYVHEAYSFLQAVAWHCQLSFTRQSAFFRQMLNKYLLDIQTFPHPVWHLLRTKKHM
jgi:hypothetical protein